MRVSTNLYHVMGFNAINKHQNAILDIQEKLSTGNRVNRPSDDPVGQSQIHTLNRAINTIDQYAKNGEYAKSQLVLEETAVKDTIDILQRIRELGIQMSNDTYGLDQRRDAAKEIEQLQLHIKGTMNMKNSEGEYMFAGNNVKDTPYVDDPLNPGFLTYIANPNAGPDYKPEATYGGRFVQIGFDHTDKLEPDDEYNMSRVRITDSGDSVFGFITYPSTSLPPGVDDNLWNVLEVMRTRMVAGQKPGDDVLDDLKNSITNMSEVMADIGGRQVRIETQYEAGESFKMPLMERRSNVQEMDLVEGISKFTVSQNALQMAQQVFTKVQGMSLFNYMR